jgi:hypothetical protein
VKRTGVRVSVRDDRERKMRAVCGVIVLALVLGASTWPVRAATNGLASLPLAAQSTISATLGRNDAAYHAVLNGDCYRADNPQQALAATFATEGVDVRTDAARWGLAFGGYGRGDVEPVTTRVPPNAAANRVEYRRGALTEWYVNGPLGLEQGFTLATPPATHSGAALTVALTLSGDVTATADPQGREVTVAQSDGHAVLRYRGLTAYDAAGRELHAWLELHGEQLRLRVDDTGARYPVVVDPFVQQAKLTASDGASSDEFGYAVAISGNTAVVGAENHNGDQGVTYVFVKPAGGWASMTETAELTASDGLSGDFFGSSVAIDGDTVVVGAPSHPNGGSGNSGRGAAYVFVKPAGGWMSWVSDFVRG